MLPGAAHISNITSFGFGSRSKGGSIDTNSYLDIIPESVANCKYLWNSLRIADFLN